MTEEGKAAAPAKPSIGQAALLTPIVVLALIGFLALGHVLQLVPIYAGLLFFWYWISIDDGELPRITPAILGAAVGSAHAWLLQWGVHHHNLAALLLFLAALIVAIFVQIAQLLPVVINRCSMLFLTVMCAPLLQTGEDFGTVLLSILVGALYFGVIVFVVQRLLARRQAKAAQ